MPSCIQEDGRIVCFLTEIFYRLSFYPIFFKWQNESKKILKFEKFRMARWFQKLDALIFEKEFHNVNPVMW